MKKHLSLAAVLLTIVCTTTHAQLPSYLPTDGLVGWWPFNGNANDESGNGNDGVVNGAVLTEDRNGNSNSAFNFDGINDFISISNASSLQFEPNVSFSVSFWLNCGGQVTNPSGYNGIIGKAWSSGSTPPRGWQIGRNNSTFQFQSRGGNDLNNQYGNNPCGINNNEVLIGENTHLVYVFDRQLDSIKIYINDEQIDGLFCADISENMSNNVPLLIGVDREGTYFSSGVIDDIAIYNRALTQQEIQNLYTGSTPSACLDLPANLQDGLVGYWPFCGNANDESGNGNNGTVNGATLAADRFGNAGSAYSFDGVDDNVIVEGVQSLTGFSDLSISLWVNPNALPATDFMALVSKWEIPTSCGNAGEDYGVWLGSSGAIVGGTRVNTQAQAMPNVDADLDQWQQVTFIHDHILGSKIYKDGILTDSSQLAGALCSLFNDLVFGAAFDPPSTNAFRKFNGLLDDITIYNRAISPEEITQLYAVQSTGDPTAGGGGNGGSASGVPRGISYQAVARDAQGQAIVSTLINVRFTLHQGTPTGATEYSETHALTTNEIGLFSTFFGSGTAITAAFDSIVWSNSTKFLQVEIDLGNGYVDMGTQQLMSVPYALRSAESARIKNAALPIYPDNASALAGGLVAGEMYRTATGDLKVVY